MPGASEERARQRRDANACLLLGLLSFATLPADLALGFFMDRLPALQRVPGAIMGAVLIAFSVTGISAGILALVFGRRANQAIRRIEGRIFGDGRASPGMFLGALGGGIWSLGIIFSLVVLPKYRITEGVSAVGTLHTINTAAITYACLYDHGFPVKLSNLGPPKSKGAVPSEANDQAAGLIDDVLASGTKAGYRFYYVAGPVDSHGKILTYTVHADPLESRAGEPHYLTDQTGAIRQQAKRQADANSQIIEGGVSSPGGGAGSDDCSWVRKHFSSQPQTSSPWNGEFPALAQQYQRGRLNVPERSQKRPSPQQ
jgi:hypothetical protein